MTLKIYVARDKDGKEWPPDKSQEVKACEWMLNKAWTEFNHLQELFAVIVNLKEPSADVVVIREIGLGVLELKHSFGEITVGRDEVWRAGPAVIKSGIHLNPREQVRSYATQLRERLIREIMPPRMQTNKKRWNELKFQTGVCFTNSLAKLEKIQRYMEERPPRREDWEGDFWVFDIDSFTSWVRELRLEVEKDPPRDFSPVHLKQETIMRIATNLLGAVEWKEMIEAMPDGKPYGYLVLDDAVGREIFNLTRDLTTVGRSHECDVVLPSRYGRVSKGHLEIKRNVAGIIITDLDSRNGTFIRDIPVKGSVRLEHGNVLSLGGPSTGSKSCVLRFELQGKISDETTVTEQGTRDIRHPAGG